jgi:hypothetical protein
MLNYELTQFDVQQQFVLTRFVIGNFFSKNPQSQTLSFNKDNL